MRLASALFKQEPLEHLAPDEHITPAHKSKNKGWMTSIGQFNETKIMYKPHSPLCATAIY